MPLVLTIDDDPNVHRLLGAVFRGTPFTLVTALTAEQGLDLLSRQRPDVVLLDVNMPNVTGIEALKRLRKLDARIPVIFLTGEDKADTAIEAMKEGAYDFLLKDDMLAPERAARLREVTGKACEVSRLMQVPARVPGDRPAAGPADVLVGRCAAMQEVYKAIGRVAAQDVTVLVLGESGTGKELVARALYQHSRRARQPFLAINCAAIPESLLESELFGHEKGAFTGAERRRIGRFEQANGGTLFLDEIGDIPPLTQVKLLRVLQERQIERVGGGETISTDVRIIAATNRRLDELVKKQQFREDLYYRLNVFTIHLPPLRDRGEDIPLLVEHFLGRFNAELDKSVNEVAPEAMDLLRRHAWPGNMRELQSVLKRALLHATGSVLDAGLIFPWLQGQPPQAAPAAAEPRVDLTPFIRARLKGGAAELYGEVIALVDRQLLTEVLRHTDGNQAETARILGITRNTLRLKMRSLNISPRKSGRSDDDRPGQ